MPKPFRNDLSGEGPPLLHVIYDPHETTTWYPNFLAGFRAALDRAGVPYEYATRMPERPHGPVFFTRYTVQKQLLDAVTPPEHVIIHEHDIWNPFTNAYDPADLWIYGHPSLKTILLTNPSMAPWAERYLPKGSPVKVVVAGFPYDHTLIHRVINEVKPAVERERLVVFPGRLNEFYQPYLSARMGFELLERGYQVYIASPIDPLSYYPVSLWQEMGLQVGRLPQDEYYRLLSRAQAAISTTTGGSLTLALYEAHLLGATPIAPHGRPDLPPWTEVYHPRYDLLSPREALEMVEQRVPVTVETRYFQQDYYVEQLLQAVPL